MIRRSEARRQDASIEDLVTNAEPRRFAPESELVLAKVTEVFPISGTWGRWRYTCVEAWVGASPSFVPAARPNGRTFVNCLSVSELSNLPPASFLSYGVSTVNLLGSFVPVAIPVGTTVCLSPHRNSLGALVWLIQNTQAIDGTCTGAGGGADLEIHD